MSIYVSPRIREKLEEKHKVTVDEICQCFANVEGNFLRDDREDHQTDPPSYWFIAETNHGRKLKIVFIAKRIEMAEGPKTRVEIKTAFPPDLEELEFYDLHGKC